MGAVSEFAPIAEGDESQAYRFRSGTRKYVVRINRAMAGFEKDAFVYRRFTRTELPIPEVIRIGKIGNDFYCISERLPGTTLQDLKQEDLPPLLGPTARVLEVIAESDLRDITGFGPFDACGRGRYESWRAFLTSVTDRELYDWAALEQLLELSELNRMLERLVSLAAHCPETRALVHGDFGSNNVLTDVRRITGVVDWSEASIGDPLYDVANIFFWRTWLDCMEQQARYFETHSAALAGLSDRLLCYELRIGLAEIYQNAIQGKTRAAAWAVSRCRQLAG